MTATAINEPQQNPPHPSVTAITTVLKQLADIDMIHYPESFVSALGMVSGDTFDLMQENWSVYASPHDRSDVHIMYESNNIPYTVNVGTGAYEDEFGIPVTVLTRENRIMALWYHNGIFSLLGNGAVVDPSTFLLINDQLDRPRWRKALTEVGVSETNVIEHVKQRLAREKALAAYEQRRQELKNTKPAVKRRQASKAAKQARRHNR